jgi:fumarate hydratase subunit alpha/L(+)-tartrate dehydratase alpha subunit
VSTVATDIHKAVEDAAAHLYVWALKDIPQDLRDAIRDARERETSTPGQRVLDTIIRNVEIADDRTTLVCQDTGIAVYYCRVGEHFPLWDGLDVKCVPKGSGSENMSFLKMCVPADGVAGIKRFVLDSIVNAGGKPCPPGIVGVGIGGSADYAMHLAKEAIARPVGTRNPDPEVAKLEEELYELLNETGIGPMGLGGDVTVLRAHVEHADTHMTLNPVAVNYQCWAARRASAHIAADGTVDFDREA